MAGTPPPASGDDTAGTPRRKDAMRNRERLLAAAAEVFAEVGASASLKDVADRAGLGVGTVYRHMPDKDAVIAALLRPQLEALLEMIGTSLAEPASYEGFAALISGVTQAMAGSKALSEILLYQHELPGELVDLTNQIIGQAGEAMVRAQAAGQVRPDLETTDLILAFTGLHGVETTFAEHGPGFSRRLLPLLLDGMRVQPGVPSPLPVPPLVLPDLADPIVSGTARADSAHGSRRR